MKIGMITDSLPDADFDAMLAVAAGALGDAIHCVHAKDTRIDPVNAGVNGVIDSTPDSDYQARAWSYITLGLGHDETWWRTFVAALAAAGYDGVLSTVPFGRPGGQMNGPHAHYVRCPPRGRSVPFGRPGGH